MQACKVTSVVSDSVQPYDSSPPGSSVHGILQAIPWSGQPYPPPGEPLDPGIEPGALTSPALAGGFFITSAAWESTHIGSE